MKTKRIALLKAAAMMLAMLGTVQAATVCPTADLTGDCFVDLADLAVLAKVWLADCDASNDFCGGADFDASGKVTGSDAVTFALEWLEGQRPDTPRMTWVAVNDPGVPGHEGFDGQISKFETTNTQYALFLNAALATGDCVVDGSTVKGAGGSNPGADYIGQTYYQLDGPGESFDGAAHGGSSRIVYADGAFGVEAGFEDHPVTYVAWYGAAAFCSYYGWRLPTEWQWQAAADYDGTYNYGCGLAINNSMANYRGSLHPHGTTPAGAFGDYGYGLADMAGNVWEWTSTVSGNYRVLRGGSWYYTDYSSKVTTRLGLYPQNTYPDAGFRACH
jgi:hypothetical protein